MSISTTNKQNKKAKYSYCTAKRENGTPDSRCTNMSLHIIIKKNKGMPLLAENNSDAKGAISSFSLQI